jgi:hypothetical protein
MIPESLSFAILAGFPPLVDCMLHLYSYIWRATWNGIWWCSNSDCFNCLNESNGLELCMLLLWQGNTDFDWPIWLGSFS